MGNDRDEVECQRLVMRLSVKGWWRDWVGNISYEVECERLVKICLSLGILWSCKAMGPHNMFQEIYFYEQCCGSGFQGPASFCRIHTQVLYFFRHFWVALWYPFLVSWNKYGNLLHIRITILLCWIISTFCLFVVVVFR